MRKANFFFLLCLAFIIGIAAHSLIAPDRRMFDPFLIYIGFLFFCALGCGLILSNKKFAGIWCFGVGMLLLGLFRYAQIIPVVDEHHIAFYSGSEVTIRGVVDGLPKVGEKTMAYVVAVENIAERSAGWHLSRTELVLVRDAPPEAHSAQGGSVLGGKVPRYRVSGKLLLTTDRMSQYGYGDELLFTCTPGPLTEYEQSARKDGVSVSCAFPRQIFAEAKLRRASPRVFLYNIRERVHAKLNALLPDPYGGLLAGILYGDTSGISSVLKNTFRIAGLAHITALSGFNISIMLRVLIAGLISLWLTRRQALPVALIFMGGFVLATGAEASVVRAGIMGVLAALAQGTGRLSNMRNAIALAGAAMLAVNPMLLRFDFGFELSFLSTIALIMFSEPIAARTWIRYLPKTFGLREAGASSAAALLMTLPLILYITGKVGPFALLVNVLVVPIIPLTMAVGAIAVAVDFIFHPAALPVAWATRELLGYIINVAEYFGRFGAIQIKLGVVAAVILFCGIAGALWFWKQHPEKRTRAVALPVPVTMWKVMMLRLQARWKRIDKVYRAVIPPGWRRRVGWAIIGVALAVLLAGQFFVHHDPPLRVYFFDIGQGDGYLIRTADGFDVLVDGGPTDRIVEKIGRTLPYWDKTIELMILTHPHADHVTGLNAVLKRFKVERVLATGVLHTTNEYISWLEEIKKQGIPFTIAKAGQVWPLGYGEKPVGNASQQVSRDLARGRLEILYPFESFVGTRVKDAKIGEGGGLNDTSVVAKLIYGKTSFLLMGDATAAVEKQLVAECDRKGANYESTANLRISNSEIRKFESHSQFAPFCSLQSDVLKVGHHGSKYSSSSEFLNAVQAKYGVIQVGAKNKYGHPAFPTLRRLDQANVQVFRNDRDGDVVMESDGKVVRRVR